MSSAPRFRHKLPRIVGIDGLTPRQLEVLDGRCLGGLTNAEIAYALGITESTVKNHVTDIRTRLHRPSMYQVCYVYGREQHVDAQRPERV